MGDHRLFEPTYPFWDRRKYTVAFIDCRGYGGRLSQSGLFSIEEIASDIRRVCGSLGWQKYHVIGHSMAGMAVQRLTIDAKEEIASAILVASVPASGAKISFERRQLLLDAIKDADARKRLIDANTGGKKSDDWLNRLCNLSCAGTQASVLAGYMASWTETDFSAEMHELETPVFSLLGANDPGASETRTRETIGKWYKSSTVAILPDVGHYPMYEAPRQFTRAVSDHLSAFRA